MSDTDEKKIVPMEATEIGQERVELMPGLSIEARLTVQSTLAMEEEFDASMADVDWSRLKNSVVVLYYLAKQCNEALSREVFNQKIGGVETAVVKEAVMSALRLRLKNSPEPILQQLLDKAASVG